MVRGETFNLQTFESAAFRHFINVFTNKQSGVTLGCEVTQDAQNINVAEGYFFIQGGLLRETTGTANTIPTDAGYYKLVYEIDLSKTNTKDNFNQGSYKFIKALGNYPELTQQDLDNDGTIYQFPFAQFRITEQGIQDFKDIRPIIDYGIYEQVGKVLYENTEGTNDNVTLSDNLKDYKQIEIFYKVGFNVKSEKAIVKINEYVNLTLIDFFESKIWIHTKTVQMTNEKLVVNRYKEYSIADSEQWTPYGSNANTIRIVKVIGYKN